MIVGITHVRPLARNLSRRAYLPFYPRARLDLVLGLDLLLFGDWIAGLLVPGQAESPPRLTRGP